MSRNFTHQLVRSRTASFAQESQRSVDVSESADYLVPKSDDNANHFHFVNAAEAAIVTYSTLVRADVPPQDARNILPTGILTSIVMKANLRTLHDMAELRLCYRTQGEYQRVFQQMKKRVVEVHPWADAFMEVFCVNHGTCAFPRYDKCPIQKYTIGGDELATAKKVLKEAHDEIEFEATPIAIKGETM